MVDVDEILAGRGSVSQGRRLQGWERSSDVYLTLFPQRRISRLAGKEVPLRSVAAKQKEISPARRRWR